MNNQLVYRAAIYVRLSKEDGDSFSFGKNESNSITNQKLLIKSFLDNLPDIEVVETFEDDGFTGTNFERPGFQRMMDAIRAKKINCVVVKDFSRLGREYLEAGNLIEKIFPQLGVRFISVNDDYDSLRARTQTDNIIVPFKNLLNEQYSRDTSGKIRSALTVKRQQGLFVGAFAVYGYFRDPEDKNHMIIDKEAAEVVRDIFKMKIAGMSYTAIANRLSALKIPSPAEYKKLCGEKYHSGFKSSVSAEWSATAVKRILTNEVYCGHMIQGKRRKISYKVNAEEQIAPEKWSRVENTHDAIISVATFNEAQRLLTEDTRVGVDNEIHPLAGKVFCADCGGAMVRKMVPAGKAKYFYYVCGNNKANSKWCSPHSIRAENLEATVFAALQAHIAVILDMDKALSELDQLVWEQREINKLQHQIEILDAEIQQNEELRRSVYEDFKTGLIEKSDYESLRKGFAAKIEDAKKAQESIRGDINALAGGSTSRQTFLSDFRKYEKIQSLERGVVVSMIERISVHNGHEVDIEFRFANQFESIKEYLDTKSLKDNIVVLRKEA